MHRRKAGAGAAAGRLSGYNFDGKKIRLVYKKDDTLMWLSRILYRTDTESLLYCATGEKYVAGYGYQRGR